VDRAATQSVACRVVAAAGWQAAAALADHARGPDDAAAAYEGLRTRKDEYVGVVFDWS